MKLHSAILTAFLLFIAINFSTAQTNKCKNIYVWNFLNEQGKQDENTKKITDEFENGLTQLNECVVLDRMTFSMNYEQQQSEKAILSLNDIDQFQSQLKTIKAEIVVFGKITYDIATDLYVLKVKFQNIETSQLLRSSSINIPRDTMRYIPGLQRLIINFVCGLIKGSQCGIVDTVKPTEREFPLKIINMNKDQSLKKIKLLSSFIIEWDEGPSEKVFQIYHNGTLKINERVESGRLFIVKHDIRGKCELKTWWDDGTERREEIWVEIVDNKDIKESARYNFEQGTEGWYAQDYEDSQACRNISQSNEKVYEGLYSLKMDMNIIGGDTNYSKGEALVEINLPKITTPVDLNNDTISIWVYAPQGSRGEANRPNGFQVFVKDENYKSEYGTWKQVTEGMWVRIILVVSSTQPKNGYMNSGFNPRRITTVGLKMGSGTGSRARYIGPIYIDAVNWK